MNPRYPIYVISKGRWESRLTVKSLLARQVPFRCVIEPQEYDAYAAAIDPQRLLVLPFSNLGQGSIPARNWAWDHATQAGHTRHWILDDNIRDFYRLYRNIKYRTTDGASFAAIEDFVDRYTNLDMAGMDYQYLVKSKYPRPPLTFNTRIYSCILLSNTCALRWRGRYNEDTDLSLRILKMGQCTVLFHTLLCGKMETMTMKGGNTDQLYKDDGRLRMAQSLQEQHPDVAKIVFKWNRWQHSVDYRPFRCNKLELKPGVTLPTVINEYGMTPRHTRSANKPD